MLLRKNPGDIPVGNFQSLCNTVLSRAILLMLTMFTYRIYKFLHFTSQDKHENINLKTFDSKQISRFYHFCIIYFALTSLKSLKSVWDSQIASKYMNLHTKCV